MKHSSLAILLVAATCAPASAASTDYSAVVMADTPLAYWQFDDPTCGLDDTAADSSGYGYDMVYKMEGTAVLEFTDVTAGTEIGTQALVLPGGDPSWVETVGASGLHLDTFGAVASQGSTIEFWINTSDTTNRTRIFSQFCSTDRTALNMMLNTGNQFNAISGSTELQYRTMDNSNFFADFDQSEADIYDGQWHHVAWTFDASDTPDMAVYVDGSPVTVNVRVEASNSTMNYFDNPIRMGAGGYAEPFSDLAWVQYGEIMLDEVAVYDRKLETTEISEHYNAVDVIPIVPPGPPDPPAACAYSEAVLADAPVAYYRFEEDTVISENNYAVDASGNAYHMQYVTDGSGTLARVENVAGSGMGATSLHLQGAGPAWTETCDYNEDGSHLDTFGSVALNGSTVEFWINTSDTDNQTRLFSAFNSSDSTALNMWMNKGEKLQDIAGMTELEYRDADGGGEFFADFDQSEVDIYDGEWHHVAWMIDVAGDPDMAIYVDGVPVTLTVRQEGPTESQNLTDFQHPLRIGTGGRAAPFGGLEYGDILIDDVAIYYRLLEASELAEHIAAATGSTPGLEGDLDGDGFVGSADLDIVRGNWGQAASGASEGDPSGDGVVGSADLDIIRGNWGASLNPAAVPEPGMIALLLVGIAGLALNRSR